MFVIRQARMEDASTLLKLAKMVHFINLPPDTDIISNKVVRSRRSFDGQVDSARERQFVFVLEEMESANVVGTSSIASCISWPGHPHVFLQVRRREHFSEDLQTGQVHLTLQLGIDESGPSEIGGLILSPSYRGHRHRLGGLLSLIRFHFIGLHPEWFSRSIIAEMMGPLTPDSRNLLWDYLGRRFINLGYTEADGFSQNSKEFILSLFPKDEIYASLLPAVARNLIGKVGPETEPARAMLERLGFRYTGRVDPFDGGPYLEAVIDEIPLVANTRTARMIVSDRELEHEGFVSFHGELGFRAVRTPCQLDGDEVRVSARMAERIGAEEGDTLGVTPMPSDNGETASKKRRKKKSTTTKGRQTPAAT